MPKLTRKRVQEIADHLLQLRLLLEFVNPEEIQEILKGMTHDEAIGPLLDPTKWMREDLFTKNRNSRKFLEKLLELRSVSVR